MYSGASCWNDELHPSVLQYLIWGDSNDHHHHHRVRIENDKTMPIMVNGGLLPPHQDKLCRMQKKKSAVIVVVVDDACKMGGERGRCSSCSNHIMQYCSSIVLLDMVLSWTLEERNT